MTRRQFVNMSIAAFSAGRAALAAAASTNDGGPVRTGLISDYSKPGIYDKYRLEGFFILRQGNALLAISSYCTHRRCKLTAEHDFSFYCKCHGSTFDPNGKVMEGPAHRDLPFFATAVDAENYLLVFPRKIVGQLEGRILLK